MAPGGAADDDQQRSGVAAGGAPGESGELRGGVRGQVSRVGSGKGTDGGGFVDFLEFVGGQKI